MENQRVNRITAVFNVTDGVTMSLYRTHTKLLELSNKDIDVKDFKDSGTVNKPAYMLYCKETLINLLENGGVTGYHYDPKNNSEQSKSGIPSKFDEESFVEWSKTTVMDILDGMKLEDIIADITDTEMFPNVTEKYKDGHIKYASINVPVRFNSVWAKIPVDIKSGQLSKPKKMEIVGGEIKGLNPTTIKALVKKDEEVDNEEIAKKPVIVTTTVAQPIIESIVTEPIIEKKSVIPDMTDQLRNRHQDLVDENPTIKEEAKEDIKEAIKEEKVEEQTKEPQIEEKGKGKASDDITDTKDTKASVSKMMKALKSRK